jgi:hypothetical protein
MLSVMLNVIMLSVMLNVIMLTVVLNVIMVTVVLNVSKWRQVVKWLLLSLARVASDMKLNFAIGDTA